MFHQGSFRSRSFGPYGPRFAGAPNDWRRPIGLSLAFGQQLNIQSDRLPTLLQSLTNLRPARPSKGSSGKGSDASGQKPKTPGSLQINLLFTIFAEQASGHQADANFYFFRRQFSVHAPKALHEGGKRLPTTYRSENNLRSAAHKARGRRPSLAGPSGAQRR
jgi:hypothetical protein